MGEFVFVNLRASERLPFWVPIDRIVSIQDGGTCPSVRIDGAGVIDADRWDTPDTMLADLMELVSGDA